MKVLLARGLPLLAVLVSFLPTLAWGHPGHGNPTQENTIWHYLLEPEHLFPIFAGLLLTGSVAWIIATREKSQ